MLFSHFSCCPAVTRVMSLSCVMEVGTWTCWVQGVDAAYGALYTPCKSSAALKCPVDLQRGSTQCNTEQQACSSCSSLRLTEFHVVLCFKPEPLKSHLSVEGVRVSGCPVPLVQLLLLQTI